MKLLGLFLLFILSIYLICDDRKRYAELRKYKKMMRQSRREARKEFWQKMRTRFAKPRKEEPDSGAVLKETKQRYQNVVLDFSFPEYRQENLDFINKTLSRYALKDVTVTDHSGALVKDENGIGHYALKRCTLSCDLMPSGPGLDFQISTMAASKTVLDCGLLWQQKNPGRKLCRKVFRHLGNAYALVWYTMTGRRICRSGRSFPGTGSLRAPLPWNTTSETGWKPIWIRSTRIWPGMN